MLIRVSVAGQAQPEVIKTKPMPPGTDPMWCECFPCLSAALAGSDVPSAIAVP